MNDSSKPLYGRLAEVFIYLTSKFWVYYTVYIYTYISSSKIQKNVWSKKIKIEFLIDYDLLGYLTYLYQFLAFCDIYVSIYEVFFIL